MAARYTITFKDLENNQCVFTIFDSDFGGSPTALIPGSVEPVVISTEGQEDNSFHPIVATLAELTYINDGSVPISTFETANAVRFTCEYTVGGSTRFKGILSLDDLSEKAQFPPVECRLTFTDGLGLLKNYTVGDTTLNPTTGRYRIVEILQAILEKTGLSLGLNTFSNAYEVQMDNRTAGNTNDPLYQASLNIRSYLKNAENEDSWETCYDALEKIVYGLQCRIFQHGGKWSIVRIVETVNNPAGTEYDDTGAVVGPLANFFTALSTLEPLDQSQVKALQRAARKITQTFKYEYPQLLRNANLTRVGNLRGTTVDGDNTIYRYDVVDIALNQGQDAEIRVVRNTLSNREIDRYLYMYFNTNLNAAAVFGPVEADINDGFILTFRYRGVSDSNFSGEFRKGMMLDAYSGNSWLAVGNPQLAYMYFVEDAPSVPTNFNSLGPYYWKGSDDITTFMNAEASIENPAGQYLTFPTDGLLYIGIFGWNNNRNRRADVDAIIENIRFEYVKFINGGQNVEGHEHIISQSTDYNREEQEDVFVDDSPATSVKGTLFYVDGTNVPNRTSSWSDDETNFYRLGELNAIRRMGVEGLSRYIVQGTFYGKVGLNNYIEFSFLPGKKFLPTRFTTSERGNVTEGTFVEVADDRAAPSTTYEFKYIYE